MFSRALLVVLFLLSHALVQGQEGSFLGYEQIVEELQTPRTSTKAPTRRDYSFNDVRFHGGIGFVSSFMTILPPRSAAVTGFLQGYEANFGIDLFDPEWVAEGAVRSFGESEMGENQSARVALREFDLKVVYSPRVSRNLKMRIGMGLTARYMSYDGLDRDGVRINQEYTTPSTVLVLGALTTLTRGLALGLEVGYRSAMIEDTIDDSAIDGLLKMDLSF